MLKRAFIVVALLSTVGCASYEMGGVPPAAEDAHDVGAVVQDRRSLEGKVVVVNGFLTRRGNFFFLSQGKRRADNAPGKSGEAYTCSYEGQPRRIWFADSDLLFQWNSFRAQYGSIPNDISRGRLVILKGILTNDTPRDPLPETDLRAFSEMNLARRSVGPLRSVEILAFFDQQCGPD
jgi:hypothetical protein